MPKKRCRSQILLVIDPHGRVNQFYLRREHWSPLFHRNNDPDALRVPADCLTFVCGFSAVWPLPSPTAFRTKSKRINWVACAGGRAAGQDL